MTTTAPVPNGGETLAQITSKLEAGVTALGGDDPPAGGGPGPRPTPTATSRPTSPAEQQPAFPTRSSAGCWQPASACCRTDPSTSNAYSSIRLFEDDDDFLRHLLHGDVDPATGLLADPTPPYKLYPANLNQIGPLGNPFADSPPTTVATGRAH